MYTNWRFIPIDLLESAAFTPVQSDMRGNVKKIREKHDTNPEKYKTLQKIVIDESNDKKKTATEGLLWLKRGLEFTSLALRRNVDDPNEELADSFKKAYDDTLKQYHNFLVKNVFSLAMKACPYRKDFYQKLGSDQDKVNQQLKEWLVTLESLVGNLKKFYIDGKYE